MNLLDGLRAFVATAQTGSFTAAAERLGLSNRLTSKYVAALEADLGTRLLQRTTRKVGLTPAGEDLLARAPALLDELDDMLAAVTDASRGFSGTLRISAPVTFGEVYVQDLLSRFSALHPDLVIDLRLDDRYADLAGDGIDLAFRIGTPDVASMKMRKLGTIRSAVVAAPSYLAARGTPRTPLDLTAHDCIVDTNRRNPFRWILDGPDGAVTVPVRGRMMVNNAQVARDLAMMGRGIAFCPAFVLRDALQTGRLVTVLDAFAAPAIPLNAAYLEGRTLPRKVRALIEFAHDDMRRGGFA
ncbi:MAG: LysR family transcriptional regulator [Rhodobacteraceae bacterium]|nr:LysR family transcriptional regulator [Paracoccaceae bacterium]